MKTKQKILKNTKQNKEQKTWAERIHNQSCNRNTQYKSQVDYLNNSRRKQSKHCSHQRVLTIYENDIPQSSLAKKKYY